MTIFSYGATLPFLLLQDAVQVRVRGEEENGYRVVYISK